MCAEGGDVVGTGNELIRIPLHQVEEHGHLVGRARERGDGGLDHMLLILPDLIEALTLPGPFPHIKEGVVGKVLVRMGVSGEW